MRTPQFLHERKWQVALLLSIIVPAGVLAGLGLSGLLNKPAVSQTINLNPVSWNMTRPASLLEINNSLENVYADETIQLNFKLFIWAYDNDDPWWGEYGDYVEIDPRLTVNLTRGHVDSLTIRFSGIDNASYLDIIEDPIGSFLWVHNLQINTIEDGFETPQPYVAATAVGKPKDCSIVLTTFWRFCDKDSRDHVSTATLELVYFDGEVYKKIVAPVQFGVLTDDHNNSFDEARDNAVLEPGEYTMLYLGSSDPDDYFRVHAETGQRITVVMRPPNDPGLSADFDLFLYDKDEIPRANSTTSEDGALESVYYDASEYTGDWFIRVRRHENHGFYSLSITIYFPEGA